MQLNILNIFTPEEITFIKYFIAFCIILICCYAIYHEKDIARIERKITRYIKAFFKALYYTIKDIINKNK